MDTDKIKKFFVWLFTLVGLVLVVIGGVGFVNLGLKTYVFPKADYNYCPLSPVRVQIKAVGLSPSVDDTNYKQCKEQQSAQKQRDASQALAELLVGLPIFVGFLRKTK